MPKLFVALDLPSRVVVELVAIQPPPSPGVRLVEPDQMHLTLRFIGEMDAERCARITQALAVVTAPTFGLNITGVGQFPSADGATTLWSGVDASAELLELHATVGKVLAEQGIKRETRPYTPHVSLARCSLEVPDKLVQDFLARQHGFKLEAVPVTQFSLYSSAFQDGVPKYQREQVFSLRVER